MVLASATLQQSAQDEDGCFFVQWLIVVAALGALDTGGTAGLAGALADGLQRCLPQLGQKLKPLLSDTYSTREGIVDENLRLASVGMMGCGKTADVQTVTHGEERQDTDGRVLHGVQPTVKVQPALGSTMGF